MSPLSREAIRESIRKNITVLNRLESHLGCVICRGPLADGRCPKCQPEDAARRESDGA